MNKENLALVFGYRSYLFKLTTTVITLIIATWLWGIVGFIIVIVTGFYLNHEALDMKKITLNNELLHVTRYVKLTDFDCKFWLKDIESASVYWRAKHGKGKGTRLPQLGGTVGTLESYYLLHVILKNGDEHEIELLGLKGFEQKMINHALIDAGINNKHDKFKRYR